MTAQLHSAEIEQTYLGCILMDQNILDTANVTPDVFYIVRNRVLFETMLKLHKSGKDVNNVTISDALKDMGKLAEFGGDAYITELIMQAGTSYSAQSYETILNDKYARRAVSKIAEKIVGVANDEKSNLTDAIPGIINDLSNIQTSKSDTTISISQLMGEALNDIDARIANPSDIWGIETGYPSFDYITGGLQKGEIFILSGVPGKGKSMWAMQAGLQMGQNSKGVIYSLEMRRLAVARRWISGKAGVDARTLKSGRVQDGDYSKIVAAVDKIASSTEFWMCDEPRMKLGEFRSRIAKAKIRWNIDWFILDYLYLLDVGTYDDTEKTNIISQELKLICREFDVAGIAIHSMNQAGMKNISQNNDNLHGSLRGSAQSEYSGDLIAFLKDYDPEHDKDAWKIREADRPNIRDLVFGKGRELANPKQYIRYVKNPNLPYFAEYKEAI